MAAINITVNNNLYSVDMDWNDWTGLTVIDNGVTHIIAKNANNHWKYKQTSAGPIEFSASAAAHTVQTVNPGSVFIMAGANQNHLCMLAYTAPDPQNTFTLTAFCHNVSTGFSPTGTAPFTFSQVHMTGVFQHG